MTPKNNSDGLPGWLPAFPWEGPPVPRYLVPKAPATSSSTAPGSSPDSGYVITVRKRGRNPIWLTVYQRRFAEANRVANRETAHLTGAARMEAKKGIMSREMRRAP